MYLSGHHAVGPRVLMRPRRRKGWGHLTRGPRHCTKHGPGCVRAPDPLTSYALDGYARIGQERWAAWRRKLEWTNTLPANFGEARGAPLVHIIRKASEVGSRVSHAGRFLVILEMCGSRCCRPSGGGTTSRR